ncbi:hypothetical protein O6H91_15G068800 [Diphasiastrum complanatum]|uniref:Uncharacterized protein n=4 Tax=Diphasiastrum complanatum TaxID=34168 RepID=A0ACC2BKC0_DIPCM|nr:hypothetical protein O6H91_15G068800 [Diphasiastrum complanatum]KAJ7529847.1 hypothetical protein O6H91_15G068800 [Diphasiastrum complanatum]
MAKPVAAKDTKLTSQATSITGQRRTPPDKYIRDDCVAYALSMLWDNLDQHIQDKLIFPRVVSRAVGRTVAEMVQMVSIGHIHHMNSWCGDVDGSVREEWDLPGEPIVSSIDSWARKVIPIKNACISESDSPIDAEPIFNLKEVRQVTKRPTTISSTKKQEDNLNRMDSITRTKQQGSRRRPIEGAIFALPSSKGGLETAPIKSHKISCSKVDGKDKKRSNNEIRSANQRKLPTPEAGKCLPDSALRHHDPSTMGSLDANRVKEASQAVQANGVTVGEEKNAGKGEDLYSIRSQRPSVSFPPKSLSVRSGGEAKKL